MTDSPGPPAEPVRPIVALALATATFVALLIFGLGVLSLVLNADVIATPGLGPLPGVIGTVAAIGAFALSLWSTVRRPHPTYYGSLWSGLWCAIAYLGALWIAVVFGGADLTVATGVVARIATSWFGVIIVAAGVIAAWGGIALVRTRASRPRWPWEDDDDE